MALRTLSLCAGIGGIDLALRRLGVSRTVCYVERAPFSVAVLRSRIADGQLDDAPIWDDLNTFDGAPWSGAVDLVCAGFPCQPFSSASRGRRAALDLWPECRRVITEVHPGAVFLENVASRPIRDAQYELERLGFRSVAAPVSAAQVGAPTERRRYWLLAVADGNREPDLRVDAEVAELAQAHRALWREGPDRELLGMGDGLPEELDARQRIAALGNSVVPQCASLAFQLLSGMLT